jgi:hypothetical protein
LKDPGQILDFFRTDISSRNIYTNLLRQFDLEYPARKGNRRKYRPASRLKANRNAAVLSLCLVTGLSLGVGSAFADSEIPPDTVPPDLPPGKAKVKLETPGEKASETERPLSEGPPPDTGKSSPSVPKPKKNPLPKREKEQAPPEQKELPGDQKAPPGDTAPAGKDKRKPVGNLPGVVGELPPLPDLPGELLKANPPKSAGGEQRDVSKASTGGREGSVSLAPRKQVGRSGNGIPSSGKKVLPKTDQGTWVADAGSGKKQGSVSNGVPRTVKGGKLPRTASGDLDGVALGGLAALFGSLYFWRKGGDEQD